MMEIDGGTCDWLGLGAHDAGQVQRADNAGEQKLGPGAPVGQVFVVPPACEDSPNEARYDPLDFVEQAMQ